MAATRRLAVVMFTDIVGYTSLAQSDEATALQLQREQEELIRPLLSAHNGREVKSTGDGLLVEFESAREAAQCAVDIQQRLHERNSEKGVTALRVRIGIHLGDVERRGSDIFGDAVNIASRVEPVAEPGGVCLTSQVFDQIRNKVPFKFERLEPRSLKGIRDPVGIYRVVLPWDGPGPSDRGSTVPRLAVLPLANISPDPKDEYFADGLTEELISVLSQIHGLRVIARTSVGQYKSTQKSISQVGAELDVTSILEGSVRKAGTQLRITLQLIDVGSQEHTWSESFNRELNDVFAVQAEIAEKTAKALRLELLKSEREAINKPPTANLEAYKSFLQGVHTMQQLDQESAVSLFEEAIRQDPTFALAYSFLANTLIGMFGQLASRQEILPRTQELVTRALELDPLSSGAHSARGNFAFQLERNWELAETELKKAIQLNPSDSAARFWYGLLLKVLQRYDEAIVQLISAIQLDPLSVAYRSMLGSIYLLRGDVDSAVEAAQQTVSLSPFFGHSQLAWTYFDSGRKEEAQREARLTLEALPTGGPLVKEVPLVKATINAWIFGSTDEARALLAQWKAAPDARYISIPWVAGVYILLGEREEALNLLERDNRDGDQTLWFFYQNSEFDPIRDDPRFVAMLRATNLPTTPPKRQRAHS